MPKKTPNPSRSLWATSTWLKTQDEPSQTFFWQTGYGMFSVSESKVPDVTAYIQNQAEHHQRLDFKSEFRLLCQRHGIELDEQHAWD
ncbi:transposase [Blastopirellula sp. J2-11]|uniref:transposase n=1 Tax=Blastopirellula sp. J2-11 TaxID=2943192 RepID=UPI0021C7DD3C|nr:transposase [Blastopirellula sp. J2-11]UUO07707.1 transposase [Blastopirellula sp. J2-11]